MVMGGEGRGRKRVQGMGHILSDDARFLFGHNCCGMVILDGAV